MIADGHEPPENANAVPRPAMLRELAAVAVVCGALNALGAGVVARLQYDRLALARGEWWRLVTGHLVHLSAGHLAMNIAGFAALALLYRSLAARRCWLVLALAVSLSISAQLYWFSPTVQWYVGLSGVLHGLWAAAAVWLWPLSRAESLGAGLLLFAKLAVELRFGPLSGGEDFRVVTEAHRAGAAAGFVLAFAATLAGSAARGGQRRRESL